MSRQLMYEPFRSLLKLGKVYRVKDAFETTKQNVLAISTFHSLQRTVRSGIRYTNNTLTSCTRSVETPSKILKECVR